MDRRLIVLRSAATALWIAALAHAAVAITTSQFARSESLIGRFMASDSLAVVGWGLVAMVGLILEVVIPLCLTGCLGAVLWLAADIWVRVPSRRGMGDEAS
jgi:hypothetical protein